MIRTVPELKKKWQDIKSSTKTKEGKRRKELKRTGGGEADYVQLNEVEALAVGVIGNTAIEGVNPGIDSFQGDVAATEVVPSSDIDDMYASCMDDSDVESIGLQPQVDHVILQIPDRSSTMHTRPTYAANKPSRSDYSSLERPKKKNVSDPDSTILITIEKS